MSSGVIVEMFIKDVDAPQQRHSLTKAKIDLKISQRGEAWHGLVHHGGILTWHIGLVLQATMAHCHPIYERCLPNLSLAVVISRDFVKSYTSSWLPRVSWLGFWLPVFALVQEPWMRTRGELCQCWTPLLGSRR